MTFIYVHTRQSMVPKSQPHGQRELAGGMTWRGMAWHIGHFDPIPTGS